MALEVLSSQPRDIEKAARTVKAGGVVAFPTDTVYGLGCDPQNPKALGKVLSVKGGREKPLPALVASQKLAGQIAVMDSRARALASRFWPGPLTMVLDAPLSGKKMGFRIPDNKIAIALIKRAGTPMVVPSANLSGEAAAVDAAEVLKYFNGRIEAVLDGGRTHIGVESTVVDMTGTRPKILRHGAILKSEILKTCS